MCRMRDSPTQRSLALLRREGWNPEIVERRITPIIKRDLWGFVDLLCVNANGSLLAVQTTSGAHMSARLAKSREAILGQPWLLKTQIKFEVHGWRKIKGKWECRREEV